ncbi:hypothetical protein E1H12_13735 [Geitlerinema sp. P-1104]|uniref:hypothetical protein n=1 Tax=Geitlerinema sp. P-1104 TaxID=2546230 RepID=UPI0014774698|nr:hypothetical protein [Geitlerinema sp. P-1104]NMG59549.1 hypothetical protein [Geitlerinema sp. P-1104]
MEDWLTEWVTNVEKSVTEAIVQTAESIEAWTDEVVDHLDQQLEEAVIWSQERSDEVYNQLQEVFPLDELSQEIDRTFDDWLQGLEFLLFDEDTGDWDIPDSRETSDPFVHMTYVTPTKTTHPACIDCRHYHGHQYGDTLLVCGMHPYGWDGEDCPDWETLF